MHYDFEGGQARWAIFGEGEKAWWWVRVLPDADLGRGHRAAILGRRACGGAVVGSAAME
jgi:hypothetical protein